MLRPHDSGSSLLLLLSTVGRFDLKWTFGEPVFDVESVNVTAVIVRTCLSVH